jgi:hypothetical protein
MNRPGDLIFYFESYDEIALYLTTITNAILTGMPDHPYTITMDRDDDFNKICLWVRFEGIHADEFVGFAHGFYNILPGVYDGWGIDYTHDPPPAPAKAQADDLITEPDDTPRAIEVIDLTIRDDTPPADDDLISSWCMPEL